MAFYTFRQNNSGGRFTVDKAVAHSVIVQADSAEQANERAESIGIYFDGVDDNRDCACCGDRWYRAYDGEKGTKTPQIYGKSVKKYKNDCRWDKYRIYRYVRGKMVLSKS